MYSTVQVGFSTDSCGVLYLYIYTKLADSTEGVIGCWPLAGGPIFVASHRIRFRNFGIYYRNRRRKGWVLREQTRNSRPNGTEAPIRSHETLYFSLGPAILAVD